MAELDSRITRDQLDHPVSRAFASMIERAVDKKIKKFGGSLNEDQFNEALGDFATNKDFSAAYAGLRKVLGGLSSLGPMAGLGITAGIGALNINLPRSWMGKYFADEAAYDKANDLWNAFLDRAGHAVADLAEGGVKDGSAGHIPLPSVGLPTDDILVVVWPQVFDCCFPYDVNSQTVCSKRFLEKSAFWKVYEHSVQEVKQKGKGKKTTTELRRSEKILPTPEIMGLRAAIEAKYELDPETLGKKTDEEKKKTLGEQLSAPSHMWLTAVLAELRWKPNGGRHPSNAINTALKVKVGAAEARSFETLLKMVRFQRKLGNKDGEQEEFLGVRNPAVIQNIVVASIKLGGEDDAALKRRDSVDRAIDTGRLVTGVRGFFGRLVRQHLPLILNNLILLVVVWFAILCFGMLLYVPGWLIGGLPGIVLMFVGSVILVVDLLVTFLILQTIWDIVIDLGENVVFLLSVVKEWMEKMVGEREDEKSRRNAFANFGLRTTTAISVYFLGNLAIYTSSLFFGGPDLVEGVISAAAAARLFLFGSTVAIFITSMSASQRSKEHPAEYWGAMFLHGMDVSTSVVHRRISFACYALAVFLLIPSVWVVDKAQGWGSVGGETVEFRLDTQDNYLVTAADGKMRRIENTPLHPFFKSGSLKRRSDNAVIISPTAHLMDLGGDGLDYRIRKDGSIRSVVDSNELGSPNKVAQNTQSNGGFWHGLLSSLLF